MRGHDRRAAQQATELDHIAHAQTHGRDNAHGGGLVVHHADGSLVCNHGREGRGGGVAGNGYHVQADGADGGHSLELIQGNLAGGGGFNHADILRDRNEGAGKTADVRAGHETSLLNRVVEQREGRDGAVGADGFQTHLLEDVSHGVTDLGGGCQGEVDDVELHAQALGGEGADQLAHAGNLEGRLLNFFRAGVEGFAAHLLQGAVHHAGAGDAHGDGGVCLLHAVEGAGHEGVVADGVGEDHELGAAEAVRVGGQVGGGADGFAHELDGAHVDAGTGGADIHGGADHVGLGEGAGNGANQLFVGGGHALIDEGAEAAHEVHAHGFGRRVEGAGELHVVLVIGCTGHQRDGGDGDALVDNRDAELGLDAFADAHEVCRAGGDLLVNLAAGYFAVGVGTVEQGDAHGDGADIEFFFLDHADGFENIAVHHGGRLEGVHCLEDGLGLNTDLHPLLALDADHGFLQVDEVLLVLVEGAVHNHGEVFAHDGLGDVQDVDLALSQGGGDRGDDALVVDACNGDDDLHGVLLGDGANTDGGCVQLPRRAESPGFYA